MSVLRSLKLFAHHSQCLFDYVNQTWLTPHKERFVKAWTNKVIHLGSTTTIRYKNSKFLLFSWFMIEWIKKIVFLYLVVDFICRIESAHWALKRLLQNNLEDL